MGYRMCRAVLCWQKLCFPCFKSPRTTWKSFQMLRKIGGSDCWILSVYFGRMVSSLFDDVVQFRTAHMTVRGYHTVPMNLKLHVSPSLVNILHVVLLLILSIKNLKMLKGYIVCNLSVMENAVVFSTPFNILYFTVNDKEIEHKPPNYHWMLHQSPPKKPNLRAGAQAPLTALRFVFLGGLWCSIQW